MAELIVNLIQDGWLKTERIIKAFQAVQRKNFLPPEQKELAHLNEALPIGQGQTISQPLVVAFMLELLQPRKGDKVLDIGSGSGWTSALLAQIVGEQGRVVAIERILELKEFGQHNIAQYNFIQKGIVKCICADGVKGCAEEAPFDRILCSADLEENVPFAWKQQLKIRGRLVTPIQGSIWLYVKEQGNRFVKQEHPGFIFVPLIREVQ